MAPSLDTTISGIERRSPNRGHVLLLDRDRRSGNLQRLFRGIAAVSASVCKLIAQLCPRLLAPTEWMPTGC